MECSRADNRVKMWRFCDWPRPHLQSVADGLVEPKLINKCPTVYCVYLRSAWARDGMRHLCSRTPSYRFWFYQARGTKSVPEMSLHILTLLSARKHFVEFCRRESYKIYTVEKNAQQILVFCIFGGPWTIPPHVAASAATLSKSHRLWLLQGPGYRTHFTTIDELFSRFMIVHRFTVVP